MNTNRARLIRCLFLLLLAALAFCCGFFGFLALEEHGFISLIFSIGYVLAWAAYTFLARQMRFWNILPLIIAAGTVLIIAEILLLTYTTATLPSFMILVTIVIAIPTLYPLLGFSAIGLFSAPGFLVIFLLASAAWCVICAANLSRKTAKFPQDTAPPSPDTSEQ